MRPSCRRGFTLIELLVVIAIIAVLIALLLPAVHRVRDAADKAHCQNNLKQIGLAAHQYHDSRKVFPEGMRWRNGKDPWRMMSWLTQLLPYVEQNNLWAATQQAYRQNPDPLKNPPHVGLATVIPTYVCPSDGRAAQVQTAPRDNLQVALTCYLGVSGVTSPTQDGMLYRDSRVRIADVTDGTSNTLLAGERPPSTDFQFGWWYAGAGQRFTGSADMLLGVREENMQLVTAGSCPPGTYSFAPGSFSNQCDMFHFWSPHSGGATFLFADGSVRFLTYSSAPLLPALATRAGGEAVPVTD
jgi:prepilin-type N-terminal cleavage/methylation domain-containing protein/prepilin-type processing-associated H-X9-DG protein